jgi:hypothetical protein
MTLTYLAERLLDERARRRGVYRTVAQSDENLKDGHLPSFEEGWPRRTNFVTLPKTRRGRGGQTWSQLQRATALPVCAAKERDHFLSGAATPPQGRGCAHTSRLFHTFHWATPPAANANYV